MKEQLQLETPAKLKRCFRKCSLLFYWIFCILTASCHYYSALVPLYWQIHQGVHFMEISHTIVGLFLICTNYAGVFAHLFTVTLHESRLRRRPKTRVAKVLNVTVVVAVVLSAFGNIARHTTKTRPTLAVMYTFYTVQALLILLIVTQYAHMMSDHTQELYNVSRFLRNSSLFRRNRRKSIYASCTAHKEGTISKMHQVHALFSASIAFIIFNVFTDCVYHAYYIIIYAVLGSSGVVFALAYFPLLAIKLMTLYLICSTSQKARNSVSYKHI